MNARGHDCRLKASVGFFRRTVLWAGMLCLAWLARPVADAQALFEGPGEILPPALENMYTRGLAHLAKSQSPDGSWSSGMGSQPAVVGLALLSVLAHGDDPNAGLYSETIRRGLKFILEQQNKESGYIGSSMYNHGFATLALAEAYGMVDDPKLGPALASALKLILSSQAQNPFGGWRYSPTSQDADTTVSGAQMVALFAARNAGLAVPEEAIQRGLRFYLNCQSGDGGFGYTGPGGSNGPRTAIGVLVFELARKKGSREFKSAMQYLRSGQGAEGTYYHYYLYYASQAFFHTASSEWEEWNQVNLKLLETAQKEDGSWESSYGTTFGTACSLLSLALNYRYLPIYER